MVTWNTLGNHAPVCRPLDMGISYVYNLIFKGHMESRIDSSILIETSQCVTL